jgi:hypothetical protein
MHDSCEQLELPLFSSLSFEEILGFKGIRDVAVVLSPRLKNSWRVKFHSFSKKRTLFVPSYFQQAPDKIKEAVIEWAALFPKRKHARRSDFLRQKKSLEHVVLEFIISSGQVRKRARKVVPGSFPSEGIVYDLQEVFDLINATYFGGAVASHIRWNKNRGRSYQTSFTDTHGNKHNLISIAQMYNRPGVPRFAIESIVYHEMLHIAIPPYKRNFKNVIHGREFKRAEQSFPYFKQWRKWEKEHVA